VSERSPLLQILRTPPSSPPASAPVAPTAQWTEVAERLRQYAAARRRPASDERCEFCGAGIDAAHGHLVDIARRALLCVCRPCYLLFTHDGAGAARFRAVPDRYAVVAEFATEGEAWGALAIPIGLAFIFINGSTGRPTAFYPSPVGATESELPLEAWHEVAGHVPLLQTMAADVEALLVRRTESVVDALIVPIDACYELVGRIRQTWRGFQGGDEVWLEIDRFFAHARARATASAGSAAAARGIVSGDHTA
jgi:hypothetical protein